MWTRKRISSFEVNLFAFVSFETDEGMMDS